MTLQEAKDHIAKKYTVDLYNLTVWMSDEAAELYARSKWDELYQYLQEKSYDSVFPSKPEFKP